MQTKNIVFLTLVILTVILLPVFGIFGQKANYQNNDHMLVEIPKSSSAKQAIKILTDNQIIKNPTRLKIGMRILNADQKIHAGLYLMRSDMTVWEVIRTIQGKGKSDTRVFKTLTIPEGLTINEVAEEFVKSGLGNKKDFLLAVTKAKNDANLLDEYPFLQNVPIKSIEGYLFPDTYAISPADNADILVRMMLNRFSEKVLPLYTQDANQNLFLHEILTLASIIEKEAVADSERAIVSSVFHNRLAFKMNLASCPTVKYALDKPRKPKLYYKDLEVRSPYNTYRNVGLPPGPICSPGIKSIEAALNPAKTKYLYFAAKGDGTSVFTNSSQEHYRALRQLGISSI